jgi:hypothetical protein
MAGVKRWGVEAAVLKQRCWHSSMPRASCTQRVTWTARISLAHSLQHCYDWTASDPWQRGSTPADAHALWWPPLQRQCLPRETHTTFRQGISCTACTSTTFPEQPPTMASALLVLLPAATAVAQSCECRRRQPPAATCPGLRHVRPASAVHPLCTSSCSSAKPAAQLLGQLCELRGAQRRRLHVQRILMHALKGREPSLSRRAAAARAPWGVRTQQYSTPTAQTQQSSGAAQHTVGVSSSNGSKRV